MDVIGQAINNCYKIRAGLAKAFSFKSFPANDLSNELSQNGIVILKDSIPKNLIDDINHQNQRFFQRTDPSELIYSPDGKELLEAQGASHEAVTNFYFLHVKNFHLKFDVYTHIVPHFATILSSYYKSNYFIRDVYCYRTQPIPQVQGSYQWHTDNYPSGSLKVIIYLTDVPADKGPFGFALKSHIGFKPSLGRVGPRYEESYVSDNFKVLTCSGERGTVILFNNNAIHRAVDPLNGYRDVINFTIFPCIFPDRHRTRGLDLQQEKTFLKKYTR